MYLQKVKNVAAEKQAAAPQPLSRSVIEALEAYARIAAPPEDAGVPKVEVHETVSNVAWAYEKLRNAIDYQDEHLLRKNAIERFLKRRLVAGVTAETIAEPLVLELISSRYLPNNTLPTTKLTEAAEIINTYIHLWTQVPTTLDPAETDRLFRWYVGMIAVQLNELFAPTDREEALLQLMFEVTHRDITFATDEISEEEKNTQLYIALHRALLKSDTNIIRYHLFIRRHPEWLKPTPETIAVLGHNLPAIRQAIEGQLRHRTGELLQRIMKQYAIIFIIFDDLARRYGPSAKEQMVYPDQVVKDVMIVYENRQKIVRNKIARSTIRSIIYVFLTKMLLALLLEVPVDRIFSPRDGIDYRPLAINIGFHPFLLFLIGVTIVPPGPKNLKAITEKVQALLYHGNERHALVRPRKPIRRNALFTFFYRVLYGLTFFIVFGLIVWGLTYLQFSPFSMVIFLFFLTIVSFFGIRVRLLAKELLVVDQKENIFTIIFDFFTVPILQVGRWIALRAPKLNILIFFFDVIIEAPFKAFLQAVEGFFGFLKEKREEIY